MEAQCLLPKVMSSKDDLSEHSLLKESQSTFPVSSTASLLATILFSRKPLAPSSKTLPSFLPHCSLFRIHNPELNRHKLKKRREEEEPSHRSVSLQIIFSLCNQFSSIQWHRRPNPVSPFSPCFSAATTGSLALYPLIETGKLNSSTIKLLLLGGAWIIFYRVHNFTEITAGTTTETPRKNKTDYLRKLRHLWSYWMQI